MENLQEGKWYEKITLKEAKTYIQSNIQNVDRSMKTIGRSVIAIGYYLKNVRDRSLYLEDGYNSIWDFAFGECGISKSAASRYMTMNDRYSVDGNSPIVAEPYREFGKSQLQEMLYLTDEQLEEVTPDSTVAQIRKLRQPDEPPAEEEEQIPGQQDIETDYPQWCPDYQSGSTTASAAEMFGAELVPPAEKQEKEPCTISVEDTESVAMSQQKRPCIHRPEFSCHLTEEQMETPGDGTDCSGKCCWDCTARGECNIKCYSSAGRPVAAEVQQEEESAADVQLSAYGTPKTVYPEGSLIKEDGCEGGHDCFCCAMECAIRGKERYCREAPLGNPYPCEIVKRGFEGLPESCQFVNHDLAYHTQGTGEASPCCKNCQDPCEYICGRAMKLKDDPGCYNPDEAGPDESYNLGDLPQVKDKYLDELAQMMVDGMGYRMVTIGGPAHMQDDVIEEKMRIFANQSGGEIQMDDGVITYPCGECVEFIRGEEDLGISSFHRFANHVRRIMENWTPEVTESFEEPDDTDLELTRNMLSKETDNLDEMEKANRKASDPALEKIIRKKRLLVRALTGLMKEMDRTETEEIEQPDLPILKNNDLRKEWLDTYHEWPIWFEVPEAAEVYYRYDLPDGSSLVICEYHYWLSWKVEFDKGDPECTGTREYLLVPGYHYLEDCKSNRTAMVEKLKEIQK